MRIHFTTQDLARTYVADGPDALWELVNSVQALQSRYGQAALGGWRQWAVRELRRSAWAGPVRHRLFPIAPHASYFPDLLTPPEGALGVEAGVDAVVSTPRARMRSEIGRLTGAAEQGRWLSDVAAGRPAALRELATTMRGYFDVAVAPHWEAIRQRVAADVSIRRAAAGAGAEKLLDSFRPVMRWTPPILDLPQHPSRRDLHLDGRGLLLVPSFFCRLHPITIFDPELPQVVVYPIGRAPGVQQQEGRAALHRLLGDTRAEVLLAAVGLTTGELARRLGVSAAVISHHTAILRAVGLIITVRSGGTARHARSPLGDALVRDGVLETTRR
ncbi:MAG: winged helix-turn-helix transcriptional regulator [Hamadaea sp.]|nr:winged helix-turn-helix transcriptional regulator [Hamadaea sp.]